RCRPTSSTCSPCATAPGSTTRRSARSWAGVRVRCASACTACSSSYEEGIPMTRHDRSNLSLLERDLTALARPTPRDGSFALALRAALAARVGVVERPSGSRPRFVPRRRRAAVVAAALALAATAAVVLVGTRGTGGPDVAAAAVIAHARQALTPPPNRILHE